MQRGKDCIKSDNALFDYGTLGGGMDLIKIIAAIILPPVAAFLQVGLTLHFFINILLTLLGGVPGIVHALWLVVKRK